MVINHLLTGMVLQVDPLRFPWIYFSLPSTWVPGLEGYAVEPRDGLKLGTDLNLGGLSGTDLRGKCVLVEGVFFWGCQKNSGANRDF